jgi:hypothetical protein
MTDKRKGFAAFPPAYLKKIASMGGKAPRQAPTGFAAMNPDKLKEVSRKGGKKSKRKKQ